MPEYLYILTYRMRRYLSLIFIFLIQYSYSQDYVNINKHNIGNEILNLNSATYYPYSSAVSFINLHDDENTSVEAATDFLSKYGGVLLQLQHTGKRNFSFMLNGRSFSFDPNRIFTEKGIKATLEKQGLYQDSAAIEVNRLADSLLKKYVDNKKLVIALHNNTERGLSILIYKKEGFEARNAARVYINASMNPHDFMLTTERSFFHYLKQRKFNVVLQHHKPVDDGSLSVYAAKNKIPYINIEALRGHLDVQIKMLEALKDIIYRY